MLVTKSPTAVTVRPHADAFKGTARYYKYRPAYPPGVIKLLVSKFKLDGSGRYLDLGCGTGVLTIPLAKYFREVVAIDPESEMLAEGKSLARQRHISNIQWVGASSYELGKLKSILRPFDFVTIGSLIASTVLVLVSLRHASIAGRAVGILYILLATVLCCFAVQKAIERYQDTSTL